MPSSNKEVEIIDPALATTVEVVDVKSSAQKTPVAKENQTKKTKTDVILNKNFGGKKWRGDDQCKVVWPM
jgi:hypothetical protein